MEASALLTIAGLYGLRAGAIYAVVANRIADTFALMGVEQAVAAANRAVVLLAQMDDEKTQANVRLWHPGLRKRA